MRQTQIVPIYWQLLLRLKTYVPNFLILQHLHVWIPVEDSKDRTYLLFHLKFHLISYQFNR